MRQFIRAQRNSLSGRLAVTTALATVLLGGYGARKSYAGDCTATAPGVYSCSGAAGTDVTQFLGGTPLEVTTQSGFGLETASDNALTLYGNGGLTLVDDNASTITGAYTGIYATNFGNSLSITTTGSVTGQYTDGIDAFSYGSGLTINAVDVTGGYVGIYAGNAGSGALTVTTTGTVTGVNHDGVVAMNGGGEGPGATPTALTINVAAVSGGHHGIYGINYGSGALSITSTGPVEGGDSDGIGAVNFGTSLTIETADVTGADHGIYAINLGTSGLTITATGDVTGNGEDGIFAYNSANDTTSSMVITQSAGTTTSGLDHSIHANNLGGSLTINAYGTSDGTNGDGIHADNHGTDLTINSNVTQGGDDGISANNYGSGAISVTTTGTATGDTDEGIDVYNSANGTSLTIVAGDSVSGYQAGIQAVNLGTGGLSITTNGDVISQANDGISAYNSANDTTSSMVITQAAGTTTSGAINGIDVNNLGGSLTITANGTSTGAAGDGIQVDNQAGTTSLTITANTVQGGDDGISANNYGTGSASVTTIGTVTGAADEGVDVYNSAAGTSLTVIAEGDVSGYQSGIQAQNYGSGALSVTSNGSVTSQTVDGIYATNSGSGTNLTVIANNVSGDVDGIDARNLGTGSTTITVDGTVQGGSGIGINTSTVSGTSAVMTLNSGAVVRATSGSAISNDSGDLTLNINSGATVIGTVSLGDGSDTILLADGADISDPATVLDGGDDNGTGDGFIDQLYIDGTHVLTGANLLNWEAVSISGGTVSFADNALSTGSDSGSGLYIANGGTLSGGNSFALTGNMDISSGGTFSSTGGGTGSFSVSGNTSNSGVISLADGNTGDTFTVGGNYTGNGVLELDVDQVSQTADVLVVDGDVTGGTTTISLNGFTSDGNATDILLVDVGGSSATTDFDIGTTISGAFTFGLEQTNSDWYLRNTGYNPNTSAYESYPQTLLSFTKPLTFRDRFGNDPWAKVSKGTISDPGVGSGHGRPSPQIGWVITDASHSQVGLSASTTQSSYALDNWNLRTGFKSPAYRNGNGWWVFGFAAHYGTARAEVTSTAGNGSIDTTGLGAGFSTSWIGDGGFYFDWQFEANRFQSDLSSVNSGTIVEDNQGRGYSSSIEIGQRVKLDDHWSITPQAQISYASVRFDQFTAATGTTVSLTDGSATTARLGLTVDREQAYNAGKRGAGLSHIFGVFNLYSNASTGTTVDVSSASLQSTREDFSAEIGLGAAYSWNDGLSRVFGTLTTGSGLDDFGQKNSASVKAGLNIQF